jgi:hypothetical protein
VIIVALSRRGGALFLLDVAGGAHHAASARDVRVSS